MSGKTSIFAARNSTTMKRITLLLMVLTLGLSVGAKEKEWILASPDGRLVAQIAADEVGLGLTYTVDYNGEQLMLPSQLGLYGTSRKKEFGTLTVKHSSRRSVDETIASPFPRQTTRRNLYNELTLKLYQGFSVVFRAYNEGIAYRYVWEDNVPCWIWHEEVQYIFARNWNTTAAYVSQFDSTRHNVQYSSSFENQYTTKPLSQLDPRRLCFLPIMIHADNGIKVCLTESSLCDYPGLYLRGTSESGILVGDHAPLPSRVEQGGHNNLQLLIKDRENYRDDMDKTKHFPWRIMMVGSATEIAMNNMSYLLGEPSRVEDISWIKPGKVAWD